MRTRTFTGYNLTVAIPIQLMAWMILIASLTIEPLRWFLIPPVNNVPAFITVSIWLAQSLAVTNGCGYLIHFLWSRQKIWRNDKTSTRQWNLYIHLLLSTLHIAAASILIIVIAGFEDL